jgi:hypothetical protein
VDKAAALFSFLDAFAAQQRRHPLWASDSAAAFERASQHVERLVFEKLHALLFGPHPEDALRNQRTHARVASLAFLVSEHLDIRGMTHRNRGVNRLLEQATQQQQRESGGNSSSNASSSSSSGSSSGSSRLSGDHTLTAAEERLVLLGAIRPLDGLQAARCPAEMVRVVM